MESSYEEGEILPDSVDNYHFLNNQDKPVSFEILPLQWTDYTNKQKYSNVHVFLHGSVDDGLRKLHEQVTAWKFELSNVCNPEIFVLTKGYVWIKLQKPRRCFEDVVRKVLVAVHWIHCVKCYPHASNVFLWSRLRKMLSFGNGSPCESDLLDHISLLRDAARRDQDLAKSKNLLSFLEKPKMNSSVVENLQATNKVKSVGKQDDENRDEQESDVAFDQLYDPVCSICDDGGEVLPCEGTCMRSFHATPDAVSSDSLCESLGYSHAEVDAIKSFICPNCKLQQHQCFACGKLGSSNKSIGAEVFPCVAASCGHFYHPQCISDMIHPNDAAQAYQLNQKILAGQSFTCPVHKCFLCKQGEDKYDEDLQFALCRRCPKAYHRRCLPRKIACQGSGPQRAWNDLLPKRLLIYCMNHQIDNTLQTPERNHLIFPKVGKKKHDSHTLSNKEKEVMRSRAFENQSVGRSGEKLVRHVHSVHNAVRISDQSKGVQKISSGQDVLPLKRSRSFDTDGNYKIGNEKNYLDELSGPIVDADTKKRIFALMERCDSSFNIEESMERQDVPGTLPSHFYNMLNKSITLGRVENSVKAMRAALEKLENGGNLEEAKAICGPGVIKEVLDWRRKLRVYLAPFHHGMRYTSFGRHFTKVDKLETVVDRLHSYVQDGDTIVDFCCGANDFSCLMKQKLENLGKICYFRNFDLIQPKNDFAFEKRDWMSVGLEELPDGSQLIMGLNPPFGVKASLANKFIDKALEFRPKLLVLIVPEETMRLDRKTSPYKLVWEDKELLSGKSFYLPGSIDVNGNQLEQWNTRAPPLYLWSRPDWTSVHQAIAQQCRHVIGEKALHTEKPETKSEHPNYLMEDNYDCYRDYSIQLGDISSLLDEIPEVGDLEEDDSQAKQEEFENKNEGSSWVDNHSEDDMEELVLPATPGWSFELSSDD